MKVTVDHILNPEVKTKDPNTDEWVACRPMNYRFESKWQRLKQAWGVVTGRYDVFDWDPSEEIQNGQSDSLFSRWPRSAYRFWASGSSRKK